MTTDRDKIKHVLNLGEWNEKLKEAGDKLVVVDFTATWCPPCQRIGPVFEKLACEEKYEGVVFLKVDVDEASDVSQECKIHCMPTFQFYRNGNKVDEVTGANEEKLKNTLDKHM